VRRYVEDLAFVIDGTPQIHPFAAMGTIIELDAARNGDGLECREAGKQILPARLHAAGQLGTKDRQPLSSRL
jgi:hypothetical protein